MTDVIRTVPRSGCVLCAADGQTLYEDLRDRLFGAPGTWTMKRCGNAKCGLLWLDPMPCEEDIGKAYRTYFTHSASAPRATTARRVYWSLRDSVLRRKLGYQTSVRPGRARILAALAHLLPAGRASLESWVMFLPAPPAGSTLLDVGCGSGDFIGRMQQLGWRVRGVEVDATAVEIARGRGLDVHLGDLASMPPDQTFDVITLAHVIEHVHDPVGLLRRCGSLLGERGRLVMTTPNGVSWGHRRFGRDWLSLDSPRHLHVFNRSAMRRALGEAGLEPEALDTLAVNAGAVLPASRAIRSRRVAADDRLVRWRRLPGPMALLDQLRERLRLAADVDAGEDLFTVARRTGER